MAEQGCEVANHTNDHKYLTKIGAEGIRSQVGSVNQKIASACGVSPVLMRPPGGYVDGASLSVLGSMGMPAIMWSIDTRDWQHRNAQRTIDTVLDQVKDGDIILMHDIYEPTAQAAEVLIPELTARGYQLVTVSELASFRGGIQPDINTASSVKNTCNLKHTYFIMSLPGRSSLRPDLFSKVFRVLYIRFIHFLNFQRSPTPGYLI